MKCFSRSYCIRRLAAFPVAAVMACAIFAFSLAVNGAGAPEKDRLEEKIIRNFSDGDYYELYGAIEKFVLQYPTSPEAYLYFPDLAGLADVYGYKRVRKTLETLLQVIQESSGDHKNLYALAVKLELEKLLKSRDYKSGEKYSREIKSITKWLVAGPYLKYGAGDFDYSFLPEVVNRFDDRSVSKRAITLRNADGVLDLERYLYPRRGTAYALTGLRIEGNVKLRVYSRAHYKLFINGREALKNAAGRERACRIVRIQANGPVAVMMKVYNSGAWNFRIITTDDNDAPISVESGMSESKGGACEFSEVMDYPFEEFLARQSGGRADAGFKLGNYFEELDSTEALRFYRQAVSMRPGPMQKFFLARCLIDNGRGDKNSAFLIEGRRLMHDLAEQAPECIPARQWVLQDLIERQEIKEAYRLGSELVKKAPRCLPLREDYCRLLATLPCSKEFLDDSPAFCRAFPESPVPLMVIADYYRYTNSEKCIEACLSALERAFDRQAFEKALSVYKSREKYDEALKLIKKYDFTGRYDDERTNILIAARRLDEAKRAVFESLAETDNPDSYVRLGLISYLQNEDPAMDWARAITMDPSMFSIGDLLKKVTGGGVAPPLSSERIEKGEDRVIASYLAPSGTTRSRVLLRGKIIQLNRDGSNRAFFEEVIYIADRKGIDRWGEYRIDQSGQVNPVKVRVYSPEGSFSDSYSIEKVNGAQYVNLPSLKEKSVLHISYFIDNPFVLQGDSGLMSIPFTTVQDFEEPVDSFYLKVLAPQDVHLRFSTSSEMKIETEKSGSLSVYSIKLKNLPAVRKEGYMGSSLNYLPYYAVSSFRDYSDFMRWYNGLAAGAFVMESAPGTAGIKGDSIGDITRQVYMAVTRDIDLTGHVLYYPEKAADTGYRKRGTAEDKVVLAKAMLDGLGIRSYVAFARNRDLPKTGDFVSPHLFTHILLFVPLGIDSGVFLDFSNRSNDYGVVDPAIENTEALILLKEGYEWKKVTGRSMAAAAAEYDIRLDSGGPALFTARMIFYGSRGSMRAYFRNKLYREDVLYRLLAQSMTSPGIDDYHLENLDGVPGNFIIDVKGSFLSPAIHMKDRMLLRPVINKSAVMRYILAARREHPVVIEEAINESDTYTYRLPAEFKMAEVIENHGYQCRFGYAGVTLRKVKGSNELAVRKEIHVQAASIEPGEYAEFLDFCLKINAEEMRRIVLLKQ